MTSRKSMTLPKLALVLVVTLVSMLAHGKDIRPLPLPSASSLSFLQTGRTARLSMVMPMRGRKRGKGKGENQQHALQPILQNRLLVLQALLLS